MSLAIRRKALTLAGTLKPLAVNTNPLKYLFLSVLAAVGS
jgi:hypothetical protein